MTEELTLRDIKRVERLESNAKKLIKLERDFFPRLFTHIKKLREEYNKAQVESPTSAKTLILADDLKKIEALAKDIYVRRERKIVLLALEYVNGARQNIKFLTEWERETFNQLVEVLEKGRNKFLEFGADLPKKLRLGRERVIKESKVIEKIADEEIVKEKPAKEIAGEKVLEKITSFKDKDTTQEISYKIVRILEDLPSFLGLDLKNYSLSKDDVVTLPEENALLLCKNKKAEEIIIPKK